MKILKAVVILGLLMAVLVAGNTGCSGDEQLEKPVGKYDSFAKCLTGSGVKMYGAYWCPHCTNQKQMFGDSVQHLAYVECSLPHRAGQTEVCKQAGIQGYPTWVFKDGKTFAGELSMEQLSRYSGCKLG